MKKYLLLITLCVVSLSAFSQNVGISDQIFTPQSPLHIYRTTNGNLLQLTNPTTTNAAGRGLLIQALGNDFSIINNENGFIRFHTNNIERMRITAGGFVGINLTAPTHQLTVQGPVETVRLIGPNAFGHGARLNYGDGNFVYLEEDLDDRLHIWASGRTAIMGGFTGIGTLTPGQRLHVSENAQVDGYLRVGNAPVPSTLPSNSAVPLFRWTQQDGLNAMLMGGNCGAAGWSFLISGLSSRYEWDNVGSRSYSPLISPWVWLPSTCNGFRVELSFNSNLENGFDGVYVQYTTDGATWTTLNSWAFQGYTHGALTGSNNLCSGNYSGPAWSNTGDASPLSNTIAISGSWIRFRIIGTEDASNNSGRFELYGFTVWTQNVGSIGGAYAAGNIYAQRNIYAGSNVLLGDVAEFFPVDGFSRPGYLISMNPQKNDAYIVSRTAYDANVIGIHSTAPTVTLNDPNSGTPVALAGRVPVWITEENGKIQPGDYLTSSSKQGYAMKADKACYVIGQALEFSTQSEQQLLCLVKQGWHNPNPVSNMSSGQFFVSSGQKNVTVIDASVSEKSKIFLTIKGDPGCRYWVSEKKNGGFTISFSEVVNEKIFFDYIVKDAKSQTSDKNSVAGNEIQFVPDADELHLWKFDSEKNVYWKEDEIIDNYERIPVPADNQPLPPPIPQNMENGYTWINGNLNVTFEYENHLIPESEPQIFEYQKKY